MPRFAAVVVAAAAAAAGVDVYLGRNNDGDDTAGAVLV